MSIIHKSTGDGNLYLAVKPVDPVENANGKQIYDDTEL